MAATTAPVPHENDMSVVDPNSDTEGIHNQVAALAQLLPARRERLVRLQTAFVNRLIIDDRSGVIFKHMLNLYKTIAQNHTGKC